MIKLEKFKTVLTLIKSLSADYIEKLITILTEEQKESHMISSKGKENTTLGKWSTKYNIVNIKANYNIGARKSKHNNQDNEILIMNY